jgi:hypothetical protein
MGCHRQHADSIYFLIDRTVVLDNKMRLLIRLEPKAYFTSYVSQI